MKSSLTMLAIAASLGEVQATWGNWNKGTKYTTPGNSDNYCDTDMESGWTWDNLDLGDFSSYNGWDFSGWSCKQDSSKRSLDGRTFGKSISGSCGSDVSSAPSFSCGGSSDVSSFSIKTFEINVEFDCRMEFHYDMPDGSTCKQSSDCTSGSSNTITNSQCGGATKVSFVYPSQDLDKDSCGIDIPKVDFDCTTPDTTTTGSYPSVTASVPEGSKTETYPAGEETTSYPAGEETTSVPYGEETTTVPSAEETTTFPYGEDTTTVPSAEETTTFPYGEDTTTVPSAEETTTVPSGEETTTVPYGEETTTAPSEETTTAPGTTGGENSGETTSVPYGEHTTFVTSYDSTSTVYTTQIKTITSCAPEVTNCPAKSGTQVVVTETVAISTTVCPVTETITGPAETKPVETKPATTGGENSGETTSVPSEGEETKTYPAGEETTAPVEETKTYPAGEETTAPAEETTAPVEETKTYPAGEETTAPATTGGENSGETTSVPYSPEETTIVTSYDSTSTIYSTQIKTITSCAPEVTNCPAKSGTAVVVTETVAVSTTICPVTETQTIKPSTTKGGEKPSTTGGESSGSTPSDSYDVPDVVPNCVNTFLDYVEDCSDNTDTACYCPKQTFVDNVFSCLYAHGESDDVVAKAVSFFQGLCAGYVTENPGICTGAESITSIITVTGTTVVPSAVYTTITIDTTVTEPCVTGGSTIEGSSTVRTISSEYTVPAVELTTGQNGGIGAVPPVTTAASQTAPYATATGTLITKAPAGTGGYAVPTTTTKAGEVPVTGGAARNGMGIAAAFLAVALAL